MSHFLTDTITEAPEKQVLLEKQRKCFVSHCEEDISLQLVMKVHFH